jgi:hypothetical protein
MARHRGPHVLSSVFTKSRLATVFSGCGFSQIKAKEYHVKVKLNADPIEIDQQNDSVIRITAPPT